MPSIEIDFELYKHLTMLRESESDSYSDVIRRLLQLSAKSQAAPISESDKSLTNNGSGAWVIKGVSFPLGTEFRAVYKGVEHFGIVENGALSIEGKRVTSPSDAARIITNTNVNGWNFWECRFPGERRWRPIKGLRLRI